LLLARYGKQDKPIRVAPKISQATLAEMVGTTRSRVTFFLNKFKKLGFIEYDVEQAPARERRDARRMHDVCGHEVAGRYRAVDDQHAISPSSQEHARR
jgi:hypothetical protein